MLTGEFDGADRDHFFSGVILLSNNPVNTDARTSAVPRMAPCARAGYWER